LSIWRRILGIPEPQETETRAYDGPSFSISDPALAEYLGLTYGIGIGEVTETRALGITGYYRAINIVAGTIAGLPLKTYRRLPNDGKERVPSFLDKPAGPYPLSAFAWKEMVMLHLLLQGEVFLLHIYNQAGALVGLWPIHRGAVDVEWSGADKLFTVNMANGQKRVFTTSEMTHIMGLTIDGLRGIAPISLFRQAFKIGLAGELSAYRSFNNGLLIAGLVTPDTDLDEEEAKAIKQGLSQKLSGTEHVGDIAVINRSLKFTPWQMSMEDAQFIQSREFQVVEFARMLGVPPHLVGATEKQTSWGTGVAEQNIGLSRYTLMPWTSRLEEPLSDLLQKSRFCEFDYAGLLQGSPAEEIRLLIEEVEGGLLTVDEARAIRNRPPLTAKQKSERLPKPTKGGDE
jgi:HK97 family phage portal protein